jgi:hypothetical protein
MRQARLLDLLVSGAGGSCQAVSSDASMVDVSILAWREHPAGEHKLPSAPERNPCGWDVGIGSEGWFYYLWIF